MGIWKEGFAHRLRCTQNQESTGQCIHVHIRSKFTYSKWEPHDHDQHCMNTHIDTYTPRLPSQLCKMTERPGAVQTPLKGIHTAMTVSGWKKKGILKNTVWENKTGESTHQMSGTKIMPESIPQPKSLPATKLVTQQEQSSTHTYAARKISTTCQLATDNHDVCVCVARVLAPVLEEEEEWKERKQQ